MITNNLGYIFECRRDPNNLVGVMNAYKFVYKGDDMLVTLTVSVDSVGKIVAPCNMNKSLGFRPLTEMCKTLADVEKFSKSNKPYFSVLGEFFLVAAGTIVFDKSTKDLKSIDGLSFYMPKTVSDNIKGVVDNNGNQQPALICERVSTDKGINCFTLAQPTYQAYQTNFLKCIDPSALDDRGRFLGSLIL